MRNEKLAQLVDVLKKQVEPKKFNMEGLAKQNNSFVSFSDLNLQDFTKYGECGCALAWYKLLINPTLEFSKLHEEFGMGFPIVSRFFLHGCIVTAKDGTEHKITMSEETTLYEWLASVEAWLNGGEVTHYPSPTGDFILLEA